jgi:hypothetical protein
MLFLNLSPSQYDEEKTCLDVIKKKPHVKGEINISRGDE